MASAFVGSWKPVESVNLDAFMKELGIGKDTRILAGFLKTTAVISIKGDEFTIEVTSILRNYTTTFVLGVEFDDTTIDGRSVRSKYTLENGHIIQVEKTGDKIATFDRFIEDGKMITICKCGDVEARRVDEKC